MSEQLPVITGAWQLFSGQRIIALTLWNSQTKMKIALWFC